MIEHVLACLRGEADNQIAPTSVLDALQLTLELHEKVNAPAEPLQKPVSGLSRHTVCGRPHEPDQPVQKTGSGEYA